MQTLSSESDDNYLKKELYRLIQKESRIFDFIQSGSLDGVWYWDLENPSEEWMSPRFWTTLGYNPEDMPHNPEAWQDIINPDDLQLALDNFNAHCEDPDHPYDQIVRYLHSNGSTVWIRCRGLAIRDDKGKPLRMLGAHTDITSLKEAEHLLEQKNAELQNANDQLTSFAFAASHDIQAPVRNIKGLLDILQEDSQTLLDEENKEILTMATQAADRLKDLTEGILQFAEAGNTSNTFEEFDCQHMLAEIRLDLDADITQKNASLQIGDMPRIRAMPTPTRQLFQNLIGNAIKFQKTGEGHQSIIIVSSERINGGWKFSVSDNGIGIDETNLQKIFSAFNRLNLPSEYSGSGLGLALCHRAVQMHKGEIWVESEKGKGSTFHFTYPGCALN